jgi:LAO/AO transport system kinase
MPESDLAARLLARDRSAVPEAFNLIEDERPERVEAASRLLEELEGKASAALRVGITGAPGAGKSTIIDALVRSFRRAGRSVGIIAVDPSSKRSGGALLGDRLRMRSGIGDDGVYLRSMAARNRLGGLAEASCAGVEILAAVFDLVLVETVGVGQSESEVADLVHTLVFVAQPGAGDSVQFMKAGIIEMPDIFAINKADLGPAAERTRSELLGSLGLGGSRDGTWIPPAILTSARDGKGTDEIALAIDDHRRHLETNKSLSDRLLAGRHQIILSVLDDRYGSYGIDRLGGRDALRLRISGVAGEAFYSTIRSLAEEIESSLRSS